MPIHPDDMIPVLQAVYDELLQRASRPPHAEHSRRLREEFIERSGEFSSDDAAAEVRETAAWEDALVRGRLAAEIGSQLEDPAEREIAAALSRAQRGIFVFERVANALVACDLWSRAELLLFERDHVGRELASAELHENSPVCQARIMATDEGCVLLPGTIFHPVDARPAILRTLQAARDRCLDTDEVLDALLKMEHAFRTLSRVKVAFAYRPEALPG